MAPAVCSYTQFTASGVLLQCLLVLPLGLHANFNNDVVAGFLFTLDIVLLFHTGFIITCNLRKRLVMDGFFVARYYAKHASLVIDLLATVPAWVQVILLLLPCIHSYSS